MNSNFILKSVALSLLTGGISLLPLLTCVEGTRAATDASRVRVVVAPATSNQKLSPTLISATRDWQSKLPRVKDAVVGQLEGFLVQYAQGNRKEARVEALEARGVKVYMRAMIRHRQVTRISLPFGKSREVQTYSLTNTVETTFDPLNPKATLEGSRLCFNLAPVVGGGKVCASSGDIVRIITTGLP